MAEKKNRVIQYFDREADTFDQFYREEKTSSRGFLDRWFRQGMKVRFETASGLAKKFPTGKFLDVGCGSGRLALAWASQGIKEIQGIDGSKSMIELARKEAKKAGFESETSFIFDDFSTWQTVGKNFEVITCLGVLEYIPNAEEWIEKMSASCKGILFFSLPVLFHPLTPQRWLRYWWKDCPLYFYSKNAVQKLCARSKAKKKTIKKAQRDWLISLEF